jgi:para-nitrobenzyl esterase
MKIHYLFCLFFTVLLTACGAGQQATSPADENQPPQITGLEWRWQGSFYNNDTQVVPVNHERYSILLGEEGKLSAVLDCNRGGGSYTLSGNNLEIGVLFATRAMCPEDSLDMAFQKDLAAVQSWLVKDEKLHLILKYDTGSMIFGK